MTFANSTVPPPVLPPVFPWAEAFKNGEAIQITFAFCLLPFAFCLIPQITKVQPAASSNRLRTLGPFPPPLPQ